ncbi:uncharacterized protein DUF4251 [Maribacter sp. MAR_2009_72]|nr:uncharacterized protein DUF4251 [Maribacter sp. MAR_2009_72]
MGYNALSILLKAMGRKILYLLFSALLWNCSTTKAPTEAEISSLQEVMQHQSFEFIAEWANPMATRSLNNISNAGLLPPGSNVTRINLMGNPNYLRVMGDSVSGNLPYYGERQFNAGYGSATGIEFDGRAKSYSGVYDTDKNAFKIQFKAKNNTEQYTVNLLVYPNRTAQVSVTSSDRLSIRYEGAIKEIDKHNNQ